MGALRYREHLLWHLFCFFGPDKHKLNPHDNDSSHSWTAPVSCVPAHGSEIHIKPFRLHDEHTEVLMLINILKSFCSGLFFEFELKIIPFHINEKTNLNLVQKKVEFIKNGLKDLLALIFFKLYYFKQNVKYALSHTFLSY